MTEDEIKEFAQLPGVNHDLIIEKWNGHSADDLKYLLSLFDFMQRSKHRAENLAIVYQRQMHVHHQLLEEERAKHEGREPPPRRRRPVEDLDGFKLEGGIEPTVRKPRKPKHDDSDLALDIEL